MIENNILMQVVAVTSVVYIKGQTYLRNSDTSHIFVKLHLFI